MFALQISRPISRVKNSNSNTGFLATQIFERRDSRGATPIGYQLNNRFFRSPDYDDPTWIYPLYVNVDKLVE